MPKFTQGDYERIIKLLKERGAIPVPLVEALCDVFKRDNPKFKPELFKRQCNGETK